jgi:hypothetical protein
MRGGLRGAGLEFCQGERDSERERGKKKRDQNLCPLFIANAFNHFQRPTSHTRRLLQAAFQSPGPNVTYGTRVSCMGLDFHSSFNLFWVFNTVPQLLQWEGFKTPFQKEFLRVFSDFSPQTLLWTDDFGPCVLPWSLCVAGWVRGSLWSSGHGSHSFTLKDITIYRGKH